MFEKFTKCPSCGYFYNEKNREKCYACGKNLLFKENLIDRNLKTLCCPDCGEYIETYRGDFAQCICGKKFNINQETTVQQYKPGEYKVVCCPDCGEYLETYRGDFAQCICGKKFNITQGMLVKNIGFGIEKVKIDFSLYENGFNKEDMQTEDKGRSR